mmetsp:Transcript_15379/g.21429  ORF Transcript_15379/g.21429 Transcript_15379/m.21429 type:complete len:199 (+) Transcript_15379:148-744(+)
MKLSLFLVSAAVAVSMNNHVSMVHAVESNDTNAMNNEDDTMGYISTISMEDLAEGECEMGVASMPSSPSEAPTAADVPTPVQQPHKRAGVKGVKTTGEEPTPSPTEKDDKHDKHGKKEKKGKKDHKHHKHGDEGEHMDDVSMEEGGTSNNKPFRMSQPNKNEEEAEEEAQKKNGLMNCCGIADCVGDVKDKIPFINKC